MPNKYEEEIKKDQLIRDTLILDRVVAIYEAIRDKAQAVSKSVVDKANKDNAYFNKGTVLEDFQTELSNTVRPEYIRRDAVTKSIYEQEYNTSYFQAKYAVENQGISKGFSFDLPDPTDKQFKEARDYALSKLMNKNKMATGRNLNIAQLEDVIVTGVNQGLSLSNINKNMDIALGFRDETGKWVDKALDRVQQHYQTQRILRTEISRMRKRAYIDQWANEQKIVPSKMKLLAVRDNRVRRQSVQVDGKLANKDGKFEYPNGEYYYPGSTFHAAWDINDREYIITLDEEYPPQNIIERDPKTGKNKVVPFRSFDDYAKSHNLTKNKFGEYLYDKPKRVVKPKVIKPTKKATAKPLSQNASIKEINKWATDNGIAKTVDFGRTDPKIASAWVRQIDAHKKQFPEINMNFVGSTQARNKIMKEAYRPEMSKIASKYYKVGTESHNKFVDSLVNAKVGRTKNGTFGESLKSGDYKGVCANEKYTLKADRYIRDVKKQQDSGWWVNGTPETKTITHELGHQLDNLTGLSSNPRILEIFNSGNITSKVSGYANGSVGEMIAEAWCEYKTAPKPRVIAKEIGELMENEYKRKFK